MLCLAVVLGNRYARSIHLEGEPMRFYAYRLGSPGYISAEVAVRELPTDDPAHVQAWAEDTWAPAWLSEKHRFISRAEALMVPRFREALERWERRDDGILQDTETTAILESRRQDTASRANLGCREAAAAVDAQDDERIRFVIMEHCYDEGCGGRDFPDEPRRRSLQVVS
jgi:hypothetical protein